MFEIDVKKLAGEIAVLLQDKDYHADGWVTTREVSAELGETISTTAARLERLHEKGKIERMKDEKNQLWWRMPAALEGE